jgi:hypothetical protein
LYASGFFPQLLDDDIGFGGRSRWRGTHAHGDRRHRPRAAGASFFCVCVSVDASCSCRDVGASLLLFFTGAAEDLFEAADNRSGELTQDRTDQRHDAEHARERRRRERLHGTLDAAAAFERTRERISQSAERLTEIGFDLLPGTDGHLRGFLNRADELMRDVGTEIAHFRADVFETVGHALVAEVRNVRTLLDFVEFRAQRDGRPQNSSSWLSAPDGVVSPKKPASSLRTSAVLLAYSC